jgi:predicted Zn finger-like uncharacterized protein
MAGRVSESRVHPIFAIYFAQLGQAGVQRHAQSRRHLPSTHAAKLRMVSPDSNHVFQLKQRLDRSRPFVAYAAVMSAHASLRMNCPHCGAAYKVVRLEAPSDPVEVACRSCGGPLPAREGTFLLKYFLVDKRRKAAPPASASHHIRLEGNP